MFEGVYKVIKGVFCNICREHLITKYYRVFVVDIAKKKPLITLPTPVDIHSVQLEMIHKLMN